MSGFRLTTVERLRERQAQICVQQLHEANQELVRAQAMRYALMERLRSNGATALSQQPTLTELVLASAYRERLRGDLRDGKAEIIRLTAVLDERRAAWLHANTQLRAITALHDRYRAGRRIAIAHKEQTELDELAGTRRPIEGSHQLGAEEVTA